MKILFIGCVESSYILMKRLIELNANIVGVITKKSSAINADFHDLSYLCRGAGIDYIYVSNINDNDSHSFIKTKKPDVGFCFGWSQLINKALIEEFPKGIIGFHPATLPHNRGRHPIIWALALGLENTASTFFKINEKADAGDIVSQEIVEISYEDDAASLYSKLMQTACGQMDALVSGLDNGNINAVSQMGQEGNVWRNRCKNDGKIDWRMSSRNIYNLVRSLTRPYVGAHMIIDGTEYKVWKVKEIMRDDIANIEPGKILEIYRDGSFDVKAADNVIRILDSDSATVKKGEYLLP